MPLTHEIRDDTLWVTTVGDVEFDDGLAAFARALEDARSTDPAARWDIVFDLRRSSELRSAEELEDIARFVGDNLNVLSGRCVVIAGDDLRYGLSRQFQVFGELHGLRPSVVRSLEDAARALSDDLPARPGHA
jgi:hypothetical protein